MSLLVIVAVLVVVSLAGGLAVVRSAKQSYAKANEVVPGSATRAPPEWAGSQSGEARLHRRLRDAVAALRTNPTMADAWMLEARIAIEQQALAVDERLVAVAALPPGRRGAPMRDVSTAVEAIETAVASLAENRNGNERVNLDRAMAEAAERVALLDQARSELQGGGTPPSTQPDAG